MASGLTITVDRRFYPRLSPLALGCSSEALLRPGQHVTILNLSIVGALIESSGRLTPGARAELQLFVDSRRYTRGRILRSRVSRLAPISYEAAILFDEPLASVADEQIAG